MKNLQPIIEIAEELGLKTYADELKEMRNRSAQENPMLFLPLVGEFSSGKTSLINALTDSKKLETATEPTTATIYEIHFGNDINCAKVLDKNNNVTEFSDISEIKNTKYKDAKVVTVYDTSKRIPKHTIIIDTPGLSSPDPKHKQTLVEFLPNADAIILVCDINQQITRTLTEFIETTKLSMRPIYLVLTKKDTKSESDTEKCIKYIVDNCNIPLEHITVVSSIKNELDGFYKLINEIEASKKEIIIKADTFRTKNICEAIKNHIDELISTSKKDTGLDEALEACNRELRKIENNINKLVDSIADETEVLKKKTSREFEDSVQAKLYNLAASSGRNFDGEAIGIINNASALMMNKYKQNIAKILKDFSEKADFLSSTDLSFIQSGGLSYNLDLNSAGHEYDKYIKTGLIAAAAVGGAVALAGASAGAGAASAAATIDTAIDVADTVSDVASIASNNKTANRIEKAVNLAQQTQENYRVIHEQTSQGMLDGLIGSITDKMMGKPQRLKKIRDYVNDQLAPEFKNNLDNMHNILINTIKEIITEENSTIIKEKQNSILSLKKEREQKRDEYKNRINRLKEQKTTVSNFI